ncbi:unnamed protein product [Lampetra planeri]
MATGGPPFEDSAEELHNWTVTNGSLEDRLNNMKKANRSSEKNKKKLSTAVVESRLTNDISPESTPGAGRRRARTPHSFPHVKYSTQMSVPDQAELDKLHQRINFTDLDERSIGSDSQGRVTAANNQRQLAGENKKPYNFLPLHVNTNKRTELPPPSASAPATPAITKEAKKQGPVPRDTLTPLVLSKEVSRLPCGDVERARENEEDDGGTLDSAVGSGSLAESTSLNMEAHSSDTSNATGGRPEAMQADQKEELENLRKQHELLKKMLEQQEQLRALQGRQEALMAMQHSAEQALAVIEDTVVTETTGSVSGLSITSELNEELNDLIQRFHNQLHDSQTSDMMVDAVNENVKEDDDDEEDEEDDTEDGSIFEAIIDSEQENRQPVTNIREKLYEEKLRQQKQELKQLHIERQRLFEIQGKIQDLHPCHLDEDEDDDEDEDTYHSEMAAEEEEEQADSAESSLDDDIHIYSSSRNQRSYNNRKNQGCNLKPPAAFSCEGSAHPTPHTKSTTKQQQQQQQSRSLNQTASQLGGQESDSVCSTVDFVQERAPPSCQKDPNQQLLDKLTQEKLDSKTNKPNDLSSDASSDFSLFEALRETIYSEVAALISQNEARPHFLIELFHELQLLNTDYLRQRALYSLQDILTRHLSEKSVAQDLLTPPQPGGVGGRLSCLLSDMMKRRDDVESMGNDSAMSTSSNLDPFAKDDLGIVVHEAIICW